MARLQKPQQEEEELVFSAEDVREFLIDAIATCIVNPAQTEYRRGYLDALLNTAVVGLNRSSLKPKMRRSDKNVK